jgi:hypothetical protein
MLGVFLQWAGSVTVTNVLNDLDSLGFFSYVLPFLLVFALVYAILSQQPLFKENKGSALIIALAIGLLALQFDITSRFFAILFPNLAKGLGVLVVALILIGAFIGENQENKWIKNALFLIGFIIFFIVIINSFRNTGYGVYTDFESWWNNYGAILIVLGVLVAAIVAVAKSGQPKKP